MNLQIKLYEPEVHRLSEHVYAIVSPFGRAHVRSYLIVGETAALIDTGLKSTGPVILDLVKSLGSPQIETAIHTHGHWDHIGSAAQMKEATGCEIAAHKADAAMLSSYSVNDSRFLRMFPEFPPTDEDVHAVYDRIGPEVDVDNELIGGERLELGQGVTLEVIAMPGHTSGCIGLLEHGSGMLFTGDSLPGRGPFGTLAQYEDVRAYKETIRIAASLDAGQILSGHYSPVEGNDVKTFLDGCLDEISIIEKQVKIAASHEHDLVSTTRAVCKSMHKPFMLQPLMTTQAHLKDLGITFQPE